MLEKSALTWRPLPGSPVLKAAALAYWALLTRALLTADPWAWIGGAERVPPVLDPAQLGPSLAYHTVAYLGLGSLGLRAFSDSRLFLASALAHSILCEMAQRLIPGRWANPADAAANVMGLALAVLVSRPFLLLRPQR